MSRITPCLWFDGEAEEAAQLYTEIVPNSRILEITRRLPSTPGPENPVLTVSFELDGLQFVALNGGPRYSFSEAVSFQVGCDTQEEVDRYWSRLSEGGEEGPCGWLKDRFGLSWQVVPRVLPKLLGDPDRDRADRVMQAMLKMGKLEIAELERAAGT